MVSSSGCAATIITSRQSQTSLPGAHSRWSKSASAGIVQLPAADMGLRRARYPVLGTARIALDHCGAERREPLRHQRRARVMRGNAAMLGREAEGERDVEIGELFHLPVEPAERVGTEAVRPGKPSAQMLHAQA